MLEVTNVSVRYGSFTAIRDVTFSVRSGEIAVLLGANGAGKSTLFRTISGLHKPAQGEIRLDGERIDSLPPDRIVQRGVVQCAEGRKLFARMSVYENLLMGAYVHRKDKEGIRRSIEHVYELFPILHEKRNETAGSLSGGQQQMLAIGRALMSRPAVLLLDEPSIGLAPLIVEQMFATIKQINEEGTTILLAEQNAHAALSIAHQGYVFENGTIVASGTAEELLANDDVRKAYIGT
ncbi:MULTISPECIES: ABC transporter ATP-binding protein [Geobacillus]|uniref:Branched-chain amino acid ABC transporter ATP-binding protein n=2 Tax=Geobacillus thermodenitrificans TaxID=33940 RepID=A4INH8_GEOTN|nr:MULTISPECIES: ABC transporter ATP-binding protein [Geobacillus]ABO66882.1 Branched-chain amino acid ABC transporter ATP-binding protein [Geobacillus thermodenitrificans NG80-2]ARA96773.1 branched-chain amino acid ABC transporter ATP-binding protein [Geobacillus thermodenitrificans]ARP42648.1 High-affinity branched-chain amino acid transport ATP-binding protein LivF [Geobacillus thermodenitrificans]ATO36044.1 branched-chain amino acid ABC transporter ATP-binding protein [Geobacillus thermoden